MYRRRFQDVLENFPCQKGKFGRMSEFRKSIYLVKNWCDCGSATARIEKFCFKLVQSEGQVTQSKDLSRNSCFGGTHKIRKDDSTNNIIASGNDWTRTSTKSFLSVMHELDHFNSRVIRGTHRLKWYQYGQCRVAKFRVNSTLSSSTTKRNSTFLGEERNHSLLRTVKKLELKSCSKKSSICTRKQGKWRYRNPPLKTT